MTICELIAYQTLSSLMYSFRCLLTPINFLTPKSLWKIFGSQSKLTEFWVSFFSRTKGNIINLISPVDLSSQDTQKRWRKIFCPKQNGRPIDVIGFWDFFLFEVSHKRKPYSFFTNHFVFVTCIKNVLWKFLPEAKWLICDVIKILSWLYQENY